MILRDKIRLNGYMDKDLENKKKFLLISEMEDPLFAEQHCKPQYNPNFEE